MSRSVIATEAPVRRVLSFGPPKTCCSVGTVGMKSGIPKERKPPVGGFFWGSFQNSYLQKPRSDRLGKLADPRSPSSPRCGSSGQVLTRFPVSRPRVTIRLRQFGLTEARGAARSPLRSWPSNTDDWGQTDLWNQAQMCVPCVACVDCVPSVFQA